MWIRRQRALVGAILLTVIIAVAFVWRATVPVAKPPEWNGIVPSVSTRADVEEIMGEPDSTWHCTLLHPATDRVRYMINCLPVFWIVNYGYHDKQVPPEVLRYEIQFNPNNTVHSIVVTQMKVPGVEEKFLAIADFVQQYGIPEWTTWSQREGARHVLLYCEDGIIVHAVGLENVRAIIYFTPMSTEQCMNEFFHEIATTNPYEGTDFIVSQDPWGFNGTP